MQLKARGLHRNNVIYAFFVEMFTGRLKIQEALEQRKRMRNLQVKQAENFKALEINVGEILLV